MEVMLTITPPVPAVTIRRAAARAQMKVPVRLTSRTACQSARPRSRSGPKRTIPALLTRRSGTAPKASKATSTPASSATSTTSGTASASGCEPLRRSLISLATATAAAASRSSTPTRYPAAAAAWAMARPMPRPAPVTTAWRTVSNVLSAKGIDLVALVVDQEDGTARTVAGQAAEPIVVQLGDAGQGGGHTFVVVEGECLGCVGHTGTRAQAQVAVDARLVGHGFTRSHVRSWALYMPTF